MAYIPSLNAPISMVSREEARRRVNALMLRRSPSRLYSTPELQALARMRRSMVMSWARAIFQVSGLPTWWEVDRKLGQKKHTLANQGRAGRPWPTAAAQSRAAEMYGVSPIGIEPLEGGL